MKCVNCEYSRFLPDEKGVVDLMCLKKNIVVFGENKCASSSKYKEEEKIVKFYLENYKTMKIVDIADKLKWTPNKLHYFIEAKLLPRKVFEKRGPYKKYRGVNGNEKQEK